MSDVRRLGDRYQVGEVLGRGGMAEVHEGRDLRLGRRVAIKILKPELARDPTFLARFRREAQSAASLNHPNIVAVYDTGEDTLESGDRSVVVPFIVMELVEGITLKELLHSGNKLVPERALEMTSGVLAALDYSHRHGIIHRDIKPGNIMTTTTGGVKVMDFGIARAVADTGATSTSASTVLGTAAYLSPEQAQGKSVDARSDLYSTGVVLFELLTRRAPFVADAPVAVAFAHVNEPAPLPSAIDPTLPRELDTIVARAMAKEPAQRYQSAVEFRADVERAIAGVPITRVMPVPLPGGADDQATSVLGATESDETARMTPAGSAAATGAMAPVIPGGAGDPYLDPDPAADEPVAEKKGGLLRGLGLAALILALVGFLIWLATQLLAAGSPNSVSVPRLEGSTLTAAEAALRDAGLRLGGPEYRASDSPKDEVISQSPRSGELVEEGSVVELVVSMGKEQVQVPDLIDFRSIEEATGALSEAGLTLGRVREEDSDQPEETVLRQRPEAYETVDAGSEVEIWVSNAQVSVPDVVGRTNAEARRALFNQGFEVGYGPEVETTQFAPGTVVSQDPSGSQKAKKGSQVTLALAKAPPPEPPSPEPEPEPEPSVSPAPDGGGADGQGGDGTANNPLDGTEDGDPDPGPNAGP
ncbi:MAG: Stk1 family PASTA domain-containing Ser/Thr kinase [Candidatus Nanopelagicales bacterium]